MHGSLLPLLFGQSEFSPTDISGLSTWLDATSLSLADGAAVTSWSDKSGNVAPFGQATTAQQPVFKTGILNGKSVIRFDGVDDNLTITAPLNINLLGQVNGVSFSPDSNYLAVGISVSPYIQIFKRNGGLFELLPNPSTLPPAVGRDCKFSPNGNYLAVAHSTSPFITIYKKSGDTFTKLSNPATLPVSTSYGCAWSHDTSLLAVAHLNSPYITIYSVDTGTDTFTKLANPTDLPTGQCNSVAFDSTKTYLSVAVSTSPYLLNYKITSGPTFTKLTDPVDLPTGAANDVAFSPNGSYLAFAHAVSPFVTVYSRSGDVYTKISNPATLPGSSANGVSWSPNSDYLTVSHASGIMTIYNMSGGALTKVTTISANPVGTIGTRNTYSPNGNFMVVGHSGGQFLTSYSKSGGTFTNLNRLDMLRNVSGATIFTVVKYPANVSTNYSVSIVSGTTGARASLAQTASTKTAMLGKSLDADALTTVSSTATLLNNFNIQHGIFDYANGDAFLYLNNALEASSATAFTNGNTSNTQSVSINIGALSGTGSFLTGDIAEVLVYNRALTTVETSQIYTYLNKKYFLQSPTQIDGLKAWYDASTLTGSSGTAVSSWLDQSGNDAHMYQSTSAAQPTVQTGVLNGKPIVRFDGVDDFLNMTAPLDIQPTAVSAVSAVSWSRTGNYLVHSNTPTANIYKKTGNVFNKLADLSPMTGVTALNGTAWSTDDTYLALGTQNGTRIHIFKRSGDTFTRLTDPLTLPNSTVYAVDFVDTLDGLYLVASGGGDRLFIYKMTSTDVFTLLTTVSALPDATQSTYCKFSPSGKYLYVSANGGAFITFYQRSGDTFTRLANPTTALAATSLGATWIDDENIVVGITSAVHLAYSFDGTTFQQGASVGSYTASTNSEFDPSKTYLAVATASSPFMRVYKRSGSTYTLLSTPASIPASTGRGVAWSPDGSYLAIAHTNAPFLQIYSRSGDIFTNLTKLNMLRNVGGATIITVKSQTGFAANQYAVNVSNNSTLERLAVSSNTTTQYVVGGRRLDADALATISSTTASTSPAVITTIADYSNSDLYLYLNGGLNASTTTFQTDGSTSDTDSASIRLGSSVGSGFLTGDIAEVMIFNRVLTTQELQSLHQYLGRKWGITVA